jgi:antitoxin MazE
MRTRVQKWGNSLALRIPKSFANEVGLQKDTLVEIKLDNGHIIIAPLNDREILLDQLLAQITEENMHREVETGPVVGNEFW